MHKTVEYFVGAAHIIEPGPIVMSTPEWFNERDALDRQMRIARALWNSLKGMGAIMLAAPVELGNEWPEYVLEILDGGCRYSRGDLWIRVQHLETENGLVRVLLAPGAEANLHANERHAHLELLHDSRYTQNADPVPACGDCEKERRSLVRAGIVAP